MDVVALAQHGVENAVATLGTATTPIHVAKLLRIADNVVFCFDGDAAGRKAAWRALDVSLPVLADGKAVSFLFLPAEDDPDTFVRRLGKDAFVAAIKDAKPLSQFLVSEIASKIDMGSEEGRARFVAQAKPLVMQIEAPALGAMVRRRVAEMAGLGAEDAARFFPSRETGRARPAAPARPVRRAPSLEAQLLDRILRRLDLAAVVDRELIREEASEGRALLAVLDLAGKSKAPLNLGQVRAYFDDSEHLAPLENALRETVLDQLDEAELDLESEVAGLLAKLRQQREGRRLDELSARWIAGSLTEAERAEFADLSGRLAASKAGETPARGAV